MVLGSFYDDVLRELIAAFGAALFIGNLLALARRGRDADRIAAQTVARARPGSPVRNPARPGAPRELAQAPIGRTIAYLLIGFVVMVAGIAAVATS